MSPFFSAIFVFKEDCGVCVRSVEESEQNSCNLFRSSKVRICGILMGARKKASCAIILSHVIVHSCSCFLFFFKLTILFFQRIHEAIMNEENGTLKSYLLDLDFRYVCI